MVSQPTIYEFYTDFPFTGQVDDTVKDLYPTTVYALKAEWTRRIRGSPYSVVSWNHCAAIAALYNHHTEFFYYDDDAKECFVCDLHHAQGSLGGTENQTLYVRRSMEYNK